MDLASHLLILKPRAKALLEGHSFRDWDHQNPQTLSRNLSYFTSLNRKSGEGNAVTRFVRWDWSQQDLDFKAQCMDTAWDRMSSFLTCSVLAPSHKTCTWAEQPSEGAAQQLNAQDKPDPAQCPEADPQRGTSRPTLCQPPTIYLHPGHQGFSPGSHGRLWSTLGCCCSRQLYIHTQHSAGPAYPLPAVTEVPGQASRTSRRVVAPRRAPAQSCTVHTHSDGRPLLSPSFQGVTGGRLLPTQAACRRASATGAAAATSQPPSPNAAGARWQCSAAGWPGGEPGGTRGPGTAKSRLLAPADEMVQSWWPRSPAPGLGKAACHHGASRPAQPVPALQDPSRGRQMSRTTTP